MPQPSDPSHPIPGTPPRRFYSAATPAPLEGGGHGVFLDGRPVRTPSRGPLTLPTAALAEAVAAEWAAQGESVDPHSMPLTQLANTALERVVLGRAPLLAEVVRYVDADMLCYRAEGPPDLVALQRQSWQPLLDWANETLGASMAVTHGVMPVRQPDATVAALRGALEVLDDWAFTAAQCAAGATHSVVLALALVSARVDAETCFALSRLDETWQMERWGEDREALKAREAVRRDLVAAETLVRLTRG
ncbi:ATP12 family chaperone protein [uncultured Rhodospira sp.]|uniref:ATP12 family chaperone protein n=1 Tax=uncultured Rhodospira sp. TaxID=1936189 RepID=UPI0026021419|nr:ATP12 family protein [uncultured Rhodospira sp.]